MRRLAPVVALLVLAAGLLAMPRHLRSRPAITPPFVHFESGHVRPAAMTPSGDRLLVVNTPDARLTVFDLTGTLPVRVAEIPIGLEPVAVSCLDDGTAWVVNHLSDNISIVDLATFHVRATLRVGDEPSDVVFAGSPVRAYVSVSQENRVRVYDPANLSAAPVDIPIGGRMPRALAANAAGTLVYTAVFNAGNRTSVLPFNAYDSDTLDDPAFPRDDSLPANPPNVALIVQHQAGQWNDMYGNDHTAALPYSILDTDVAEISTVSKTVTRTFGDLGAVNFGLAVSPTDGRIAVSSTEARNLQRFEPRLRGHIVDTQIGLISAAGTTTIRNLNPHVNYSVTPGPQSERDSALGTPTGIAFSANGNRLYVTSMASNRLGVIDPAGSGVMARVPTVPGPTGVVVDQARGRIYVVGRFENQLQTFSSTLAPLAVASIGFDPTPEAIAAGRPFFYGGFTSGHGDQSCATCHVFGDFDNLAWDLGDPSGAYQPPPAGQPTTPVLEGFDPMKGPMVTQSLRGLPGTGLLHWRGDRQDLNAFNPAFVGLLGRSTPLSSSEMAAFNDFVLPLVYPPNPAQHLNRTFPDAPAGQPSARRGDVFFRTTPVDGGLTCAGCHSLPSGTNGVVFPDDVLLEDQDIKVPQLRNMYKKTGFSQAPGAVNTRGFGFVHDGGIDNLFNFLHASVFNFAAGAAGDNQRRDVEAFLHAFDTGMPPAVGYQLMFDGTNTSNPTALARLDTLKGQAASTNCDLIAKGRVGSEARGWWYVGGDLWRPDRSSEPDRTSAQLLALAGASTAVTISGVPAGVGERMGVDRDYDTYYDADERDAGSDPGNPLSTPENVAVGVSPERAFALRSIGPNPFREVAEVQFTLGRPGRVELVVFDVLGREVRSLSGGLWLDAGAHVLRWDGRDGQGGRVAAGVYFVRLAAEGRHETRPVVRVP